MHQDTQDQSTVSQPQQHSSSKLFLMLGILVLLVLVGAGSYVLGTKTAQPEVQPVSNPPAVQSTPVPTAKWKTYTNSKYGFTIDYPTDYEHTSDVDVNKNEKTPGAIKSLDLENWFGPGESLVSGAYTGDRIVLFVYPDSKDSWSQIPTPSPSAETVSWGGQKALKEVGLAGFMITIGPIKHNGIIYKFQYDLPNNKADTTNFYQMLSTFKFTNSSGSTSQTIDTSTWKTYTDKKYSFTINYPSTWQQKENDDGSTTIDLIDSGNQFGGPNLSISIMKNSDNLSAKDFVNNLSKDSRYGLVKLVKDQPSYFKTYDAVIADGFYGAGKPGPSALINNKKGSIILLYNDGLDQKTIDSIYSTFKFTQ
jgi:hypothetical protein